MHLLFVKILRIYISCREGDRETGTLSFKMSLILVHLQKVSIIYFSHYIMGIYCRTYCKVGTYTYVL